MNPLPALRAGITAASVVSPSLGGRAALSVFLSTSPRMRVHPDDDATHARAVRETIPVRGNEIQTYRWGVGDETVLLVHGWRGRASQFAPLVRELVAERMQVLAFDSPGHGDSHGRHTDVRHWIAAIRELQFRHGRFRSIVGHSFGALAALTAVREGVSTRSVATVAGAATPVAFLDRYSAEMRLSPAVQREFRRRFLNRIGEDEQSLAPRYDASAHPLPAPVELLVVHDARDSHLSPQSSRELAAAHSERARFVGTDGFGHNRLLRSDAMLDAVTAFVVGGLSGVDRLTTVRERSTTS
jgi:pimeloyl-ACP methyl ester carboxylesterase